MMTASRTSILTTAVVAILTLAYQASSHADLLLASWEFNPADVNGSEVSATSGSAANTTGVLQADAAIVSGALSLDGSGDYLQFGNNVTDLRNLGAMTIAAWVQTGTAVTGTRRIVEHEDNIYGPWAESSAFKFTIHGTPGGDPNSRAVSTTLSLHESPSEHLTQKANS